MNQAVFTVFVMVATITAWEILPKILANIPAWPAPRKNWLLGYFLGLLVRLMYVDSKQLYRRLQRAAANGPLKDQFLDYARDYARDYLARAITWENDSSESTVQAHRGMANKGVRERLAIVEVQVDVVNKEDNMDHLLD